MLECLSQALLIHHLLEASGASLIDGDAIQRFSEYLVALGTSEPANVKNQVDSTLKAPHIPNTAALVLMNISTHIPAARTDGIVKVDSTIESGFLLRLINGI